MKPKVVLLFLSVVMFILVAISMVFPKEGIKITDSFSLKFISFNDYLNPPTAQYADISHLLNSDTLLVQQIIFDSLANDSIIVFDTIRANADSLRHSTSSLQFADENSTCLVQIFSALKSIDDGNTQAVRILHYGDSQIEGDRITGVLREHLQQKFGGNGIGLIPAYLDNSTAAPLIINYTGNWERHTRYGLPDSSVRHNKYGVLASFSRFTHIINDSMPLSNQISEATVQFSPKERSIYPSRSKFKTIKIFAGNNRQPVVAEIYIKDSLVKRADIDTTSGIKTISYTSNTLHESARIKFSGADSPDIYGISLENSQGVYIDNIPLRGNSGTVFTQISRAQLTESYRMLGTKLIILEFGVNVVPNIVDSYVYYEKLLYKQIKHIQTMCPEASILVIGVSDVSRKVGEFYESYPNIEQIRDAQRNAAFKANCAFWDMYQAMGGKNSMPSWVFANPPMAQKDFTHFSYRGSKIIGDMLFNAIIFEYNRYLKRAS